MKSLFINPLTDDIEFDDKGELVMIEGTDELVQEVTTVLKTNINEWFLDPSHGFNYQTLWKKKPNNDEISQALYDAIDQVDRIDRVEEVKTDFNREARRLSVHFVCVAENGDRIEGSEVIAV